MEHQFRDSQKDSRTARYVWTALAGEAWKPSAVTTRDRARRTAWVSEARWGLGWQDHSWLHKAPGSCHQGMLEVQNVVGNLLVFFFFSLPPPLLWDQTKQAHQSDTACALHCQSAVCVWGQDHKTPLCAMASILVSSWLAGLQQQTDGPRQGSVLRSSLGQTACSVTIWSKRKKMSVQNQAFEGGGDKCQAMQPERWVRTPGRGGTGASERSWEDGGGWLLGRPLSVAWRSRRRHRAGGSK